MGKISDFRINPAKFRLRRTALTMDVPNFTLSDLLDVPLPAQHFNFVVELFETLKATDTEAENAIAVLPTKNSREATPFSPAVASSTRVASSSPEAAQPLEYVAPKMQEMMEEDASVEDFSYLVDDIPAEVFADIVTLAESDFQIEDFDELLAAEEMFKQG
jgi:hypothetical protein